MPARPRYSKYLLLVLAVFMLFASLHWRLIGDDGNAWREVISSDAAGYHAYLDWALHAEYPDPARVRSDHLAPAGNGHVIKYMAGTPLLQTPLMLVAHWIAPLAGAPQHPRALQYHLAIALSGILWTLVGLFALRRLLLELGMGDAAVAWTLAIILPGTGLLFYTVMSPGMSHAYSFAAIALFLLCSRRAWFRDNVAWTLAAAACLGLIILIRPVNALAVLALPMILPDITGRWRLWWRNTGRRATLPALFILCIILAVQPVAWYAQCGDWIVRPYAGEGFLWGRPRILKSLIGAQKGLLVYWPLLLLTIPGVVLLWRRTASAGATALLYAMILVYITSAWWSWEYGDSYGPRPYLDHLAVAAVPIGILLGRIGHTRFRHLRWAIAPFILLQVFQSWQFTVSIIHPHNMDHEKWKHVHLQADRSLRNALGGNFEPPPYAPCGLEHLTKATATPFCLEPGWYPIARTIEAEEGLLFPVDTLYPYSPTFTLGPEGLREGRPLYVEASLWRKEPAPGASADAFVVAKLGPPGVQRVHYAFRMNDLPDAGRWRHWRYAFRMPAAEECEILSFYVWHMGQEAFLLDSLSVSVSVVTLCEK